MLRSELALARRQAVQHARRAPRTRVRFNSSTAGPSSTVSQTASSPLVAGLAGGGVVLVGGYAYYHFSGMKSVVDSAKSINQSFTKAKDTVISSTPSPNEALNYLRSASKSYAVFVPGASGYVDATFDGIDELRAKHGDDVDAIVSKAYNDIKTITQKGKMDLATANQVYEVLKKQAEELAELAAKVGGDIIGPIIDKHPELKEKLGGGWDDLKHLAEDAKDTEVAQKAQDLYQDTTKQLSDIFSKGFSAESLKRAKDLVDQKSKEVKELTQQAVQKVWEKGQKDYLSKAPQEVKDLFSNTDTLTSLTTGGGAFATSVAIWSKVKEVASSKAGFDEKSVQGLKDLVQQKLKEGQDKGGQMKDQLGGVGKVTLEKGWKEVEKWVKTLPGGEKALEGAEDLDVGSLSTLLTSKKGEAQDLVKETYSDIVKVLKEKADKAKDLATDSDSDSGKKSDSKDDGDKKSKGGDKDGDDKKGGDKQDQESQDKGNKSDKDKKDSKKGK